MSHPLAKADRNAAIVAGRAAGLSYRQLGRKHGISGQVARNICVREAERVARTAAGGLADLPARARGALHHLGITTLEQLCEVDLRGELCGVPGYGRKTMQALLELQEQARSAEGKS